MTNQSVINKGYNTLYYFASNIEGYEPDKTYLIRLEKKGCKVRVLRAKTKACGCRVESVSYTHLTLPTILLV